MNEQSKEPIWGAAVLKLSFLLKGMQQDPGFRVVYFGTLEELGVTDGQVDRYIKKHREALENHIRQHGKG